jgi:hypothetical protein
LESNTDLFELYRANRIQNILAPPARSYNMNSVGKCYTILSKNKDSGTRYPLAGSLRRRVIRYVTGRSLVKKCISIAWMALGSDMHIERKNKRSSLIITVITFPTLHGHTSSIITDFEWLNYLQWDCQLPNQIPQSNLSCYSWWVLQSM